jgi:hypothetical protein
VDRRVFVGALTESSASALVLSRSPTAPTLRLEGSDGSVMNVPTAPLFVPNQLRPHLERRRVHVFRASVTDLDPGVEYRLDGSRFRTLPPRDRKLHFVVGSCYYDGFKQQLNYLNVLRWARKWYGEPSFKLLIGDNLYVDIAPAQFWRSFDGWRETADRYADYFHDSFYGDVLAFLPTFTTWDDHEFWNNYPESQLWLSRSTPSHRTSYVDAGQACIDLFQASLNPPPVAGRSYTMEGGPASFFVADLRSNRTLIGGQEMFGEAELKALEAWAKELADRGKVGILVLGQPLWIDPGGRTDYNPPDFTAQYARIWRAVLQASSDVLVISGDVHFSRLVAVAGPRGRIVHELVTSPASHIPNVATSVVSSVFGFGASQGRGSVAAPLAVDVDARVAGARKLKLEKYYFGTSVPNTVAYVLLEPMSPKKVSVSCAFIDLPSAEAPLAEEMSLKAPAHGAWRPAGPNRECFGHRVVDLRVGV